LAEGQGIPVAHTMSGKGAIACTHALSAGLFGRYDRIANGMIAESDCLIVVGCKLGEIATKRFQLIPPGKTVIHIEIDPTEIGRTTRTEVGLVGDARLALEDLAAALGDGRKAVAARAGWLAEIPKRMAAWRGRREREAHLGRGAGQHGSPDDRDSTRCCRPTAISSPTAASPRTGAV
jgi:acetolactate synthase-1/2/3 large subunit